MNMNPRRIVDIGYIVVGLLVFFIMRQVLLLVWDFFRLPELENLVVSVPDLISAISGIASFVILRTNQKVNAFSLEVVSELSKVTWPEKKETFMSSVVVVGMVGLASVMLLLFDSVWAWATQKFLAM